MTISLKNIKISTYLTRCITNEILCYLRKKRPLCISLNSEFTENLTYESIFKDDSINIERDLIKKEELNDALDYYMRGHSQETRFGLRFILQRIELMRSFSI